MLGLFETGHHNSQTNNYGMPAKVLQNPEVDPAPDTGALVQSPRSFDVVLSRCAKGRLLHDSAAMFIPAIVAA